MLISGKGRYAITAMMSLAINDQQGPVSLADISQSQGISLSYLEQIFSRLRRKGLVRGTRGRRGGYCLGRAAQSISMGDIVRAVEDDSDNENENTQENYNMPVSPFWDGLQKQLYSFLDNVDLASTVSQNNPYVTHSLMSNINQTGGRDEIKFS